MYICRLSPEEFLVHLRQDQGVRPIALSDASLLGIVLIVEHGHFTQVLHKGMGLWGKTCESQKNGNRQGLSYFIARSCGITVTEHCVAYHPHNISLMLNSSGKCKKLHHYSC